MEPRIRPAGLEAFRRVASEEAPRSRRSEFVPNLNQGEGSYGVEPRLGIEYEPLAAEGVAEYTRAGRKSRVQDCRVATSA